MATSSPTPNKRAPSGILTPASDCRLIPRLSSDSAWPGRMRGPKCKAPGTAHEVQRAAPVTAPGNPRSWPASALIKARQMAAVSDNNSGNNDEIQSANHETGTAGNPRTSAAACLRIVGSDLYGWLSESCPRARTGELPIDRLGRTCRTTEQEPAADKASAFAMVPLTGAVAACIAKKTIARRPNVFTEPVRQQ